MIGKVVVIVAGQVYDSLAIEQFRLRRASARQDRPDRVVSQLEGCQLGTEWFWFPVKRASACTQQEMRSDVGGLE